MSDPREPEWEALADVLDDALSSTYVPRDELVQAAKAILEAHRLPETATHREWGVLGSHNIVAMMPDARSAHEWVAAHPQDAVVSRSVGAWTKEVPNV